jgi:hypothetical protein
MKPRRFHFDDQRITLPKGTRVVLKTDLPATDDGQGDSESTFVCKQGTVGVVTDVAYDSYTLRTPSGRLVSAQRDQLSIQKRDHLEEIARRQGQWEDFKDHVIYSAVVGSQAWGLSDESSDEDMRGVFVLPFEHAFGLWEPVDEIHDPQSDVQYWEAQKLVYQGLRADAGTLELLWSPLVRVCTELGHELAANRRMFVSQNIFGTFGRYAMSQFRKMRAAQTRRDVQRVIIETLQERPDIEQPALIERLPKLVDSLRDEKQAAAAIKDLYQSLHDRGLLAQRRFAAMASLLDGADVDALFEKPRWKNAYNLLRLLYSGIRWLEQGEPIIEVEGAMRRELMAVKRGDVPLGADLSDRVS